MLLYQIVLRIQTIEEKIMRFYVVAVQKRVAFDTSYFRSLLSYNKCI